jgi:hypothetical protein
MIIASVVSIRTLFPARMIHAPHPMANKIHRIERGIKIYNISEELPRSNGHWLSLVNYFTLHHFSRMSSESNFGSDES